MSENPPTGMKTERKTSCDCCHAKLKEAQDSEFDDEMECDAVWTAPFAQWTLDCPKSFDLAIDRERLLREAVEATNALIEKLLAGPDDGKLIVKWIALRAKIEAHLSPARQSGDGDGSGVEEKGDATNKAD